MGALILASVLDRSVMQYGTPFLPPCRVRAPPTLAYPNRRHRTRSGPKKDTPLKRELRREREGAEGAEKARASEAVPLRAADLEAP
jgi:hypothetical protein